MEGSKSGTESLSHNLKIVLVNPQIPWNTGAIGRTCVALEAELIIIHPAGFSFDDAKVKRSGLDYWQFLNISHYDSWQLFEAERNPLPVEMFFFSTKATENYFSAQFTKNSYLIFGSETAGLPEQIHQEYSARMFRLPMFSSKIRSLNLANTATAVIYEAVRQNMAS